MHPLHRGDVWCEALDAGGKKNACAVSYEAYLDRGARGDANAPARAASVRRDAESAFACHPRFARATAPRWRACSRDSGDATTDGDEWDDRGSESGSASSRAASTRRTADYCLLDALERVCVAHAARSPHGHSAAACTVAGVLLLVTEDEEKCFWMLTCFAEDVAPWAFFPCHTGLLTECLAFDELVTQKLPHLAKTCAAASVRPSLLCAGWLAKLGANSLPGESVSRLWDALVLEGSDVLPHAAVAFLKVEGDAALEEAARSSPEGGHRSDGDASAIGAPYVSGAALLDAAERSAAAHFATDDVVADAVFQARAARERVDWARARADVTRRVATRRASVASFARLLELFREKTRVSDPETETETATATATAANAPIRRDAFASLVAASYVAESRADAAAAAAAFEEASRSSGNGGASASLAAWLGACRRSESEALRACARLCESQTRETPSEKEEPFGPTRTFLRGDELAVPAAERLDAPSPASLAAAVRTARAAFVSADREHEREDSNRTRNAFACVSDAHAAALESAMLFGRGGERWLESVRGDARGAVALSAVASAVAAARPSGVGLEFSVSLATTEDIVPSIGDALLAWPPRTPHTQYAALVLAPGAAPRRVVKRFSDFRALHCAAEREGVAAAVGPALALPAAAPGTISWSSDPAVVQARRVHLQRYLDVLQASGCPAAAGLLAAFLRADAGTTGDAEAFCPRTLRRRSSLEKRREVRGGGGVLGAMTCGPSAFTGERAPIAAR